MTRRICPALAVAVVAVALAALPGPAGAQVVERDHRTPPSDRRPAPPRPPRPPVIHYRVDSFAPSHGRAGTRVTIRGSGFTRATAVLVGGRPVAVASWSATEIVFAMPRVAGDAAIALRKPGPSGDLPVGSFHSLVDPVISRVAPPSGGPGTRVELIGRGFERADTVTLNGRPLTVTEWTATRLVTVIPEGATTDYLSLSRPSGERARSPQRFRVLAQAPVIARFSPVSGPPGTRVRITGSGFSPSDRVVYGVTSIPVLGRGSGWLDVEVPRRATRSELFGVRGRAGTGRSPRPFDIDVPPVVTSFSPDHGAPGTQVELRGRNFRQGDWVSLAGKRLPIVALDPRHIRVTIPIGSESGRFAIGRDRHESPTAGRFEVYNPPTLTAFTPTRGDPGTRVTLNGSHLSSAEVHYGRTRLPVRARRGDTELVVEIPRAARDERFRVSSRAGTAESAQVFQVQYYTVIENARPRSGVAGATVVLSGRHVDKADDFFIGSARLDLVARDNDSATVRVPDGARSAPIAWTTFGRRVETTWRFEVLSGPAIAQFQPTYGPAGTEVIIRGDHIDRRTQAYFGRRPLRVVRVSPPFEITVQLPRGAAGSDYLYLEGHGARVRSDQQFEVKVAPEITAVDPTAGRPGQEVLVRGRWFTDATEILVGKVRARVVRRDQRAGTIRIEVPRGVAPGPHPLTAKTEAMIGDYRRPFVVLVDEKPPGTPPVKVRDHRTEKPGKGP